MNTYSVSAAVTTKDKDSQFIKNLLDASEKHNKNLSELIVILKKNIEEEKAKVAKLTKDNGELKRDLSQKQLNLKKAEKEIQSLKQNEQKQNAVIKGLQDSLEKYRLQLVSQQQQKTKGDENTAPSINSALSIQNIGGGLVERTGSISSLKYNHSAFLTTQEGKESISSQLINKKGSVTQDDKNNTLQKDLNDQGNQTLTNVLSAVNLQQQKGTKQIISKTPNGSEKENSQYIISGKQSIETTDSKRKPFYSIHQTPSYGAYQNQIQVVNPNKNNQNNSNSFHQDTLQNTSNTLSQQQTQRNGQDTQSFQKPNNNLRGSSCIELDLVQQIVNNNNNLIAQNNKKDTNFTFYSSKSAVQSKTNLAIQQNPNQPQTNNTSSNQPYHHSRYASETFSQKFNQQLSKNISSNQNQTGSYLNNTQSNSINQLDYISDRGCNKKNENELISDLYNKKNQGINSVLNYLSKAGQSPIFSSNNNKKEKDSNTVVTTANNQQDNSDNDIQLIIVSNQSQVYSPNIKNKSLSDDQNDKQDTHARSNSINAGNQNTTSNSLSQAKTNQFQNTFGKNRLIFQDQVYSSPIQTQLNQNQINSESKTMDLNSQINGNQLSEQQDSKTFVLEKFSNYCTKKKIEEQVKSPKFLQKDTIELQFQKINTNQKTAATTGYIKSRHESIGNSEGIFQSSSNQNGMIRRGSTNEIALQQNNIQKTPNNDNKQSEIHQRSLSNQGKTIFYNGVKPKKEEDVTITVEDVLDTIANVEEDADEAANLENLSGSHFKFMMKTSCKNLRIKTEQYFSKIENPSLSTFNKKQKEFQMQQQHQQQNILPQFGSNNLNYNISNYNTNQYDPYAINYNLITTEQITNVDDLTGQFANNFYNNPYCFTNQPQTHETARLNTEEVSKSICEKHQSVEIYNQINNKMTNFKYQSQYTNTGSISPRSQNVSTPKQENVLERKIKNKYSIHEKKEPGKMKKYLEENQMTDIGNRIFEGLMIYGPDKQEIKNLKSTSTKEVLSLSPQLYFKYPENSQIEKGREDVFQQFAFPFGVETQQICLTDSLSQLNEIIFSNNMAEANNNCFVFAIKSEESYKFQKNKEGSMFKQNEHQELLEICNPSNLLYGICFRVKEVIENGQNKNCWTTNKLFCFLTYYPFHRFFLDIISSMLNQMKMKRIEYFSRIQEKIRHDATVLSKLENEFFYNFLNKECKELLEELKKIALPSLSNRLQLNFSGETFAYQVPNREQAKHIEAEWGCSLVLSSFDKELFVNIFLSLLLEQSVVFVSSNSALLSSTMLLFHSLLKPFRWHHPLIFNLPNNFTHLMDIPVPILVGLNKDKNYVYQNNLQQKHENCLFVLLDENIEVLNSELISHIQESQFFENLVEKVSNYFEDLERDSIDDPSNVNLSNQNDSSNNNMSNSQNSNYKEMLSHSNNNSNSSHTNNMLGSNTKKNNSIFQSQQQHGRSKSFIMNAATDAFNTLIGSKNKSSKFVSSNNSQTQQFLNSNSTHRRKKTIIAYPNHQEKKACMHILSTCTDFLNQNIISHMPVTPPYQSNNLLNFDVMEREMVKNIGRTDSFLHNLLKTQLFNVFAEEKYEFMN